MTTLRHVETLHKHLLLFSLIADINMTAYIDRLQGHSRMWFFNAEFSIKSIKMTCYNKQGVNGIIIASLTKSEFTGGGVPYQKEGRCKFCFWHPALQIHCNPAAPTFGVKETLGWLKNVALSDLTLWWTKGPDSVSCRRQVHITASDWNHGAWC